MSNVQELLERSPDDTAEVRKARGAFFTPPEITRFVSEWAIRDKADSVLEPSAGDAAFLVEAVRRLRELGAEAPDVYGAEIHEHSAQVARARVEAAGGTPHIAVDDFFRVEPTGTYAAAIGNPPYVRYQDFAGDSRARARRAALRGGVNLTGLASSWAAFTVHSALFLRKGGRLGLVLPAELLSVNYAASIRKFIFERFSEVRLVLFTEQVFPEAEADVVLLLAEGFHEGSTVSATVHEVRDASGLASLGAGLTFTPSDPSEKWTSLLVNAGAVEPLHSLTAGGHFTHLEKWGDTTLGIVTGNNRYFTLTGEQVTELGLDRDEVVRISPAGSSHLRGLGLTEEMLGVLDANGRATWLFRPAASAMSAGARGYVNFGKQTAVDQAYKCRVRNPWFRVPLVSPADLLLTCMNADTPRLTTNWAGAHHLNSVHGVYLTAELRSLGRDLLPLASLNSVTLLNAEMVGRSYGGGILKIEPREADRWAMPAPSLVATHAAALKAIKPKVAELLSVGALLDAVTLVDDALLATSGLVTGDDLLSVRSAREQMAARRTARGASGR
ncbi:class I SAM-dependent DNA methyltransferase [Agromyces sp. C10]|uniref:HsdM family class I SAM-dependent methyltransferase n=1 Tax=Agromyces sp. C10 TaxID=2935077 RepID=UPI00200B6A79|nr:N-6 DNA methylase [Agromyces sp. C10]MCK8607904.1 SAM-dependent methyltransferase [Agromyces sp. C10]